MPTRNLLRLDNSPSSVDTSGSNVRKSCSNLSRKSMRNHLPMRIAGCSLNSNRKYLLVGFSFVSPTYFLSSDSSLSEVCAASAVCAASVVCAAAFRAFLAFLACFFFDFLTVVFAGVSTVGIWSFAAWARAAAGVRNSPMRNRHKHAIGFPMDHRYVDGSPHETDFNPALLSATRRLLHHTNDAIG